MQAIVLLIVVALLSLLITRIATVALAVTGMSKQAARFQARSALTGVGFTTTEAESIVGHPVRRRIVMVLMLVGNVGLVTAVAALLGGFLEAGSGETLFRATLLLGGLATVYGLSRSGVVDRWMSRRIARLLDRFTDLDARDYAGLLRLARGYTIEEMVVPDDGWLTGKSLEDLRLRDEGVIVLGVTRKDGSFIGAPDPSTELNPGDQVVLYGQRDDITALASRPSGSHGRDLHRAARKAFAQRQSRERAEDPEREDGAPPEDQQS